MRVHQRTWPGGALVATAVAAGGCAQLSLPAEYAGPAPRPASLAADFAYEPRVAPAENTLVEETDRYVVRRFTFDAVDDRPLTLDYYDVGAADTPAPVVLVGPIMGGSNRVARHFAGHFADHGLAAVIVHRYDPDKDADEIDELNRMFHDVVIDHRQAIDWIEQRPELDAERIGLFGVSAGAVKGAIVYGVEERIDTAVLALAGGDLPYLFSYSNEGTIGRGRRRALKEHDLTQAELREEIRDQFHHDPLRYAPYVDARRTLLVLARFDAAVPHHCGEALRKAMGGPETIMLPTGHYGAIVYVPYIQGKALKFLRRHLAEIDGDRQ
ncbi:MAG: alpha/beta hydrolase [Planctomycetes bacterium]|nr:alpha/beta hydrolase [Planctomycetota bacterium]